MKRNPSFGTLMPLVVFVLIGFVLYRGLNLHPERIPSPLVNQPAPYFQLAQLGYPDRVFSSTDLFKGKVTLLNVWASWCSACRAEHPGLLQLAGSSHFQLIGIDYRDDAEAALKWLHQAGNPYSLVLEDPSGKTAIDWGVYGTPETFVIDRQGRIRFRQVGIITREVWQTTLQPLVLKLEKE